ncbi:MAG: hypothetical protein LIP23_08640 [Planctomycetes bacterium]|nr:hypothetical protein [Planctomycetota bacterium]
MNKGAASPWSPGKVPPRALCWLLAILLAGGTVCLAQPLRYGENDSRAGIGAPGVNPHRISEDYDNDEDQEYDDDDEDDGIEADQNWDHDDEEGGDEEAGAESGLTADEARASDVGEWGDPELSPTREWTVLVYLDGDNDLEFPAIIDFLEMQHGMVGIDTDLVDVIVLFDRAEGYADLF